MNTPYIAGNAFYENTATNILKPDPLPINDHCLIFDGYKWHLITSRARHAEGGKSILEPMHLVENFPKMREYVQSLEMWAPTTIIKNEQVYVFFARPGVSWQKDWKNFAKYISEGGKFTLALAQAPLSDLSQLSYKCDLFSDDGGARDPFVFYDDDNNQWVMLYCKRIYGSKEEIESGIAYRTSTDLFHWSEMKGYILRNQYYDDEIRDEVTVTLGNCESPQLIKYEKNYYLFITQVGYQNYHRTKVYASNQPYNFPFPDKPLTTLYTHAPEIIQNGDNWFISNCGQHQKEFGETGNGLRVPGVEIAQLLWK